MRLRPVGLALAVFALATLCGTLAGPAVGSPMETTLPCIVHAQVGGGLGLIVPPDRVTPTVAAPAQGVLAQVGAQAQPLVQGLGEDPGMLVQLLGQVRDDPALRQQALERMRRSGGLVGVGANAVSDQAFDATLESLLSDPQRLQGILGVLESNPGLLGGMLGGAGLQGVTPEEINSVLGQVRSDPAALRGLMSGDPATQERLANTLAGSQGGIPAGLGATDPAGLSSMLGQLQGVGVPQSTAFASQLLGTGASLGMLADMLGVFGGSGAEMTELQELLRGGDIQSVLRMAQGIYGPEGSLSRELGVDVNSYADLLNVLLSNEGE